MAKTDNGIKTSNEFLNALHSGGWRWVNDDYSTGPVEIKYYFAPAGINLDNEFAAIDANGYGTSQEWTEEQKWAFKVALQKWKNVADITFTEVFSEDEADFVEYAGDKPNGILGAHLAPWHGVGKGVYAFGSDKMADSTLQMGGSGFETLLHEIGHGLGLQHPFDGVLFPGVEDGDGYSAGDDGWNQTIFTVMSYNSGWDELGNPPRDYGQAAGPSAFDIAAIQDLYGANTTYNSDDNVYHLGHYDF